MFRSLKFIELCRHNSRKLTKLAYISDIHLEKSSWNNSYPKIAPDMLDSIEDVHGLALLGDIGNPTHKNYIQFLSYCSDMFKNVYLLSGNHEYYIKNIKLENIKNTIETQINKSVETACRITNKENIQYLNNKTIEIEPNKYIIGTTLWSDHTNSIPFVNNFLQKFYTFVNIEYNNSVYFLNNELTKIENKNLNNNLEHANVTILSHYLPTLKLVDSEYMSIYYINTEQSERYFSNLDHLIKYPVKNWICGHSHSDIELEFNNVYLGINCFEKKSKFINLKFIYV